MRILLALFLMFLIPVTAAHADVCVKQHSHTDGYYYGGINTPPEDEETQMWVGENKMAVIATNRSVIIDSADSLMYFVNHNDSSYVEIALPMDWVAAAGEQLGARVMSFQRHGEITETGETKKIGDWNCKGYLITSHILYQENKYYEMESTVWVTTGLPVDLEAYTAMVNQIGVLRNYHDSFVEELGKVQGIQLASETTNYRKGFSFDSNEELLEAYEDDPPDGVYSVPEGYTKKEQITMADLQG